LKTVSCEKSSCASGRDVRRCDDQAVQRLRWCRAQPDLEHVVGLACAAADVVTGHLMEKGGIGIDAKRASGTPSATLATGTAFRAAWGRLLLMKVTYLQ
jgi:hypothetical protein